MRLLLMSAEARQGDNLNEATMKDSKLQHSNRP